MSHLRNLIKEVLSIPPQNKDVSCCCDSKIIDIKGTTLNENINKRVIMTENMQYHVQNQLPLTENTFRYGSKAFLDLWSEARYLYVRDAINVNELDQEILSETHLGEYGIFEGKKIPLDLPILSEDFEDEDDFEDDDNIYTGPYSYGIDRRTWDDEWSKDKNIYNRLEAIRKMLKKYPKELAKLESDPYYPALDMTYDELVKWYKSISNFDLSEATKKKNTKKLNKPMRDSSGGKAYKVYVKDPKTGNIKTVRFGSGGLKAKINNSKARQAFSKRHDCPNKNDKTKASYWSCRLPRYAKLLGLKSSFSGFW
jgi:hypothetical protein